MACHRFRPGLPCPDRRPALGRGPAAEQPRGSSGCQDSMSLPAVLCPHCNHSPPARPPDVPSTYYAPPVQEKSFCSLCRLRLPPCNPASSAPTAPTLCPQVPSRLSLIAAALMSVLALAYGAVVVFMGECVSGSCDQRWWHRCAAPFLVYPGVRRL